MSRDDCGGGLGELLVRREPSVRWRYCGGGQGVAEWRSKNVGGIRVEGVAAMC